MRWLAHYVSHYSDDQERKFAAAVYGKKIVIGYKKSFRKSAGIGTYFMGESHEVYTYTLRDISTFVGCKPTLHIDNSIIQTPNTEIRFIHDDYIKLNSNKMRITTGIARECFARLTSEVADHVDLHRRFNQWLAYTYINKFPIEILKDVRGIKPDVLERLQTFIAFLKGTKSLTRSFIGMGYNRREIVPDQYPLL
jgi:hypothetical protein